MSSWFHTTATLEQVRNLVTGRWLGPIAGVDTFAEKILLLKIKVREK
jgi:hypothetical protein